MHVEYTKEDQEPSYDNLTTTVGATKKTPKTYGIRQIVTKAIFKWTVLVTTLTVLTIIVVVPTVLEITKDENINGNWGNWTSFSDCSHSCGGGTQYRVRNCDNPYPAFEGDWCPGNDTDLQTCNNQPCPVNGSWRNWTIYSECSRSCGGGTQTRQRECDSVSPAYGGEPCYGDTNETRSCNIDVCPVHGTWGDWTEISGCSHSCGGGTRYRLRMCNNPSPSFGGNWCSGNGTDLNQCNTQACPDFKSAFTVYTPQDGPTSGTIKFATLTTNIGGHYNSNTGIYTCEHPGIYVFSVHLYKYPSSSVNYAQTSIRKNDAIIIWTHSNPSGNSDDGYYECSNTLVLHLNRGDRVNLGSGSVASTMYYLTSFSGFLLISD